MDRNTARLILLQIETLTSKQPIMIEELTKSLSNLEFDEIMQFIKIFSIRNYIKIDGKYSFECYTLEKYSKIGGLDRDGYEAVDLIRNDKIWNKVEKCLKENEYDDFSFFSAITLAKKIVEKEFDKML